MVGFRKIEDRHWWALSKLQMSKINAIRFAMPGRKLYSDHRLAFAYWDESSYLPCASVLTGYNDASGRQAARKKVVTQALKAGQEGTPMNLTTPCRLLPMCYPNQNLEIFSVF